MEIKVPKTLKECTPVQLAKWIYLAGNGVNLETLTSKLDFRVQVVSIFSGVSRSKLEMCDYRGINAIFEHLINILSYEPQEPTGEVIIDAKRYVFDKDFKHKSTGQIIDLKLIENVYENPAEVLGILYVEEGMIYNEVNEHDIVLNPLENRKKLFAEKFPGDEFLNVFAFFLSSYEKKKNAIWALTMAKAKMTMETTIQETKQQIAEIQNGMTGRQTL